MDELVYDRTQADVNYAIEHQSSEDFLKGAYNYTDLNRIETWCEYLKTELNEDGYTTNITTKTNWTAADFPTQAELERIRSNVSTLKTAFYAYTNVPTNMNKMTYQKANTIEKVLDEMFNRLWGMEDWYVYSGVSRSGQPRLWQHKYREFFVSPIGSQNALATENGVSLLTENNEEIDVESVPYTMLDWIQCTGTQYIDTGIVPNANTKIETKMAVQGNDCLCGSEYTSNYRLKWGTGGSGAIMYCFGNSCPNSSALPNTLAYNYTYYISNGEQWCKDENGNVVLSSTNSMSTYSTNPIFLFALYSGGTILKAPLMRIFYCKIWNGDTLVRDFIPVLDENNVACLYDKISETYFYNQGTGDFVTPIINHTQITYIGSSGTQYIDTKYKMSNKSKIVAKLSMSDVNIMTAVGVGGSYQSFSIQSYNGNYRIRWRSGATSNIQVDSSVPIGTTPHTFEANSTNAKIDGTIIGNTNSYQFTESSNLFICAMSSRNTAINLATGRIYHYTIYDNDFLYEDLIPVLKDNVPCMFDKVTYTYFYNAGTGTFLYE